MWRSFGVALALCHLPLAPTLAQHLEVTPFAGAVIPLSNVVEDEDTPLGVVEAKHKTGLNFGGRLTFWLPGSVGFEAQGGYALSDGDVQLNGQDADCADAGLAEDCLDASIFFGAAKVLYRLGPPNGAAAVHIGAGGAVISRSGDAYDTFDVDEGKTDIGGVVNLGVSFRIGPRISVRLDAEDYLSSAKFTDSSGGETDSRFQNDLTLTAGVQIGLGR